jgi:hypothetical protein
MVDLKWRKSRKNCHGASERQSFTGLMQLRARHLRFATTIGTNVPQAIS